MKRKKLIFLKSTTKIHGQACLYRKGYQDSLILFFTETPPDIATDTKTDEKMPYSTSKILNVSPTKLQFSFGVLYQTVCGVGSE